MRENLKHYDKYIQQLELYAKACNIKVIYTHLKDEDGVYMHSTRTIKICPMQEPAEEIATFLHELGHALDDSVANYPWISTQVAYANFYKKKHTSKQKKLVVECEKRAWAYGRVIAKLCKIRLGKWYEESERDAMAWYRSN